jgi:uncharacterized protein YecE (DUF72 family)
VRKRKGRVRIGTSGWHYAHWKGSFYPEGLSPGEYFPFYARQFHTAEINNTFYRMPSAETVRAWREMAPPGFVFSVKASRYITHMKKLKDPSEPVRAFLGTMKPLGDRLGPVLFQLPPRFRVNAERLRAFLRALPKGGRYAFEFRDHTWFHDEVCEALEKRGAALCIYDLEGTVSPAKVTADFVYVRLHGPDGAYAGKYGARALRGWADAIQSWAGEGRDVYCYFDNDEKGYAAKNALELSRLCA